MSIYNSIPSKNIFQKNEDKIETFSSTQKLKWWGGGAKGIHQQQACTIINVKERPLD